MIGNIVRVIVDRPLGTFHPKHKDIYYSVNYGYIPDVLAPDVEEKWVVAPENSSYTKDEIMKQVAFQEQYFCTEIRL